MVEGEKFKRILTDDGQQGIDTFSSMPLPETFEQLVSDHPEGVILFVTSITPTTDEVTHKIDVAPLMQGYEPPQILYTDGFVSEIPNGMGVEPDTYVCSKLPKQPRGMHAPVYSLITTLPREEVDRARDGFSQNEISPIHTMDFQMFIERKAKNN